MLGLWIKRKIFLKCESNNLVLCGFWRELIRLLNGFRYFKIEIVILFLILSSL